ncbi:hemerythrin family protein [Fusibacter paucivorans]|uniref:Hemerythrin family protein n=1 Tax=Fusibacter paucivorans TaxID=76009 RepID=A0ABS5PV96_9FIRM|nr:bacteriohemerythrin [Fusibacter paucivorans]MBS7528032.1 hemerythrin family protein [Fusibacter paucivorans]
MLAWKPEFEFGIPEIDRQHKQLVEIGGALSEMITDQTQTDYYDEIMAMLKQLENYTVTHFAYEEAAFDAKGFIGSSAHKFEHKLFVKKLEKYFSNLEKIDSDQKGVLVELLTFVSDWLVMHIIKTDREYVELLKA